jgi:hypothetical protein
MYAVMSVELVKRELDRLKELKQRFDPITKRAGLDDSALDLNELEALVSGEKSEPVAPVDSDRRSSDAAARVYK